MTYVSEKSDDLVALRQRSQDLTASGKAMDTAILDTALNCKVD